MTIHVLLAVVLTGDISHTDTEYALTGDINYTQEMTTKEAWRHLNHNFHGNGPLVASLVRGLFDEPLVRGLSDEHG